MRRIADSWVAARRVCNVEALEVSMMRDQVTPDVPIGSDPVMW